MRVLSAIQPTGSLHIGNYLGAIKNWIQLQEHNECVFFIADLHSLTIPYHPTELQNNIFEVAVAYLATGIDPEKSIFFVQSAVKEHTELCWLLNTVSPVGDLQRMGEYKEKAKLFKKNINAGLLIYPVLMASDILIYKADAVPVGEDQLQHLELTRTIARRFNKQFGKTFPEPKALLPQTGAKIMALNNPKQKMSKSLGRESYISLFESSEKIKRKVGAAVTDSGKEIKYNPSRKPGIANLLTIYSLFDNKNIKEVEKMFRQKSYQEFKRSLTELLITSLEPFRKKQKELLSREVYVQETLKQGAKRATVLAQFTMQEVRKKMGLT